MKPLSTKSLLHFIIFFSVSLFSCQKNSSGNNCPAPSSVEILNNGPVTEGWNLHLQASFQSTGYLYNWYGPNGFKVEYSYYANDAYLQERQGVTSKDAGEYKLQLKNTDGCIEYEGTVQIEVVPAPTPPCNVTANTSISSVAGVGDYTFNNHSFSSTNDFYYVTGSETVPGDYMRFAFLGSNPPLPGVYKTSSTGTFGTVPGTVGLYIETVTSQFVAHPNQNVYVNKVNNKLQVSFCSLLFNNPISPSHPITISTKLTQP